VGTKYLLRIAVLGLLLALLPMAPASAATATITGTITNAAGQGIPGANVKIFGFGVPTTWTATTSASGQYSIDINDLPGQVSVGATVTATGYAPSVSGPSQQVVPGQTTRIDAILAAEAIVEGTITGRGVPVAGATVQFQSGSLPPGVVAPATTDSDGHYRLTGLPATSNAGVTAQASGFLPTSKGVQTEAGQTLRIDIDLDVPGSVTGRVTDANGNPLADVRYGCEDFMCTRPLITGSDGLFSREGLVPGPQSLTFVKAGFGTTTRSVTVVAGERATLNVTMQIGSSLVVRAVNSAGDPVDGASFGYAREGEDWEAGPIPADRGEVTLGDLEAGTYKVKASANGMTRWFGGASTIDTATGIPLGVDEHKSVTICLDVDCAALPAPEQPTVTGTGADRTVTWSVVPSALDYQVQSSKDGGAWTDSSWTTAVSQAFTGLSAGTWEFRVRARSGSVVSDWSQVSEPTVVGATNLPRPTLPRIVRVGKEKPLPTQYVWTSTTPKTCTIESLSGQAYVYGKKRGFCSLKASGQKWPFLLLIL
jgi:hypothetical protein